MNIKRIFFAVLLIAACFLPGCFTKKIVWSPDGKWGAVCFEDGLYFTDAQGNISEKAAGYGNFVSWFNDSENLLVEESLTLKNWDEIQQKANAQIIDTLKSCAKSIEQVENLDQLDKKMKELDVSDNVIAGAMMYLKANSKFKLSDTAVKVTKMNEFILCRIEWLKWKDNQCQIVKEVGQFTEIVWDIRISYNDQYAVFTTCDPDDGSTSKLWLADIDNSKLNLLDTMVSIYPDWSSDGKSIVYARLLYSGDEEVELGRLLSVNVLDYNGLFVQEVQKPEVLCGLMMNWMTKVRCLNDGRILFSSLELSLPFTAGDFPDQMQLFMLNTNIKSGITPLILKSELGKLSCYNLNLFEVSGDNRYISVADNNGAVAVLDTQKGEVSIVLEEKNTRKSLDSIPVWRGTELYYLSRDESTDKAKLMVKDMSSGGESFCLSENWPDDVVEKLED